MFDVQLPRPSPRPPRLRVSIPPKTLSLFASLRDLRAFAVNPSPPSHPALPSPQFPAHEITSLFPQTGYARGMKVLPAVGIIIAIFCAGLATGVIWMKDHQPTHTTPISEHSSSRTTKPAGPSSGAPGRDRSPRHKQPPIADAGSSRSESIEHARPWIEAALQLHDAKLRQEAIEKIRTALGSGDPEEVKAAFAAFNSLHELDFDKASFRESILPYLESDDEELRIDAWSALMMSGLQEGDADRMRRIAKTSGLGDRTSYFLARMENGDLTGESGEIVRGLLDRENLSKSREVMRGLWSSTYSPELEADLVALSRQPGFLHDTVYFALSTQPNKGDATVARLIEAMADVDSHNVGGRAAWGLQQGVPEHLAPVVAKAAAEVVGSRTPGYLFEQALTLLDRYGGPEQLESMQALAAKPNLSPAVQERVNRLVTRLAAMER